MPLQPLSFALTAIVAYLIGSPPTGYLAGRLRGMDIRKHGSGNIGATNVFRILGRTAGIIVLLLDALKGTLAVLATPYLVVGLLGSELSSGFLPVIAALAVILGHNYTCWLGFQGGKGIATSAGVLAALVPAAGAIVIGLWIMVFLLSRYVSLASITAATALPLATWLTTHDPTRSGLTLVVGGLAVWKHRPNIRRLLNGTENRFVRKRSSPKEPPLQ